MKRIFLTSFLIFSLFLGTSISGNDAFAKSDNTKPIISTQGDIYEISQFPTTVSLFVSSFDDVDGQIRVDCDKSERTVFKIGKTTVRCYSMDSSGNIARSSFVVTVGYNFIKIPDWLKQSNEYLQGGVGDLPAAGNVRVMVPANDFEEARSVIADWEAAGD